MFKPRSSLSFPWFLELNQEHLLWCNNDALSQDRWLVTDSVQLCVSTVFSHFTQAASNLWILEEKWKNRMPRPAEDEFINLPTLLNMHALFLCLTHTDKCWVIPSVLFSVREKCCWMTDHAKKGMWSGAEWVLGINRYPAEMMCFVRVWSAK